MELRSRSLQLGVSSPPSNQEFPVGGDFFVRGSAEGTGGDELHEVESVTVRVDDGPPVEADLSSSPWNTSPLVVLFSATVRLDTPGEHQLRVTASDDIRRSITRVVPVATTGTTYCRTGISWNNYPNTQSLVPYSTCTPRSLAGLVAAIRDAEEAQKRVHAFGSKWSFSDCAFTSDYVIDTRQLNRSLQTVKLALKSGNDASLPYHVEAGITIRSLYENLDRLGLALETMGGASGQTLAGAVSTGTHGGDKSIAPLADSVLAIHLVGAGGTQYWIEPSAGITDPTRLKADVVPDVDPQNIVYDDAVFDACLVSLGCMGVIYAVVLRVRESYDLVETTVETTWRAFKENASIYLDDPDNRFLQILLSPYMDSNNDNYCLLTTRKEADVTGPLERPSAEDALKGTLVGMLTIMEGRVPGTLLRLHYHGALKGIDDPQVPVEQKVANLVQGVLTHTPYHRDMLVAYYAPILRAQFPSGTFRGSSYSVMDIGYGKPIPQLQRGNSIELHFQAVDADGKLGFVDFVDAVIGTVNAATSTFFAGYVSLRFTGPTRAYLGMQQWDQTCTVEIATVQDVQGLDALLTKLFETGFSRGGLPHWGQQLDLGGIRGHGSLYPRYEQWRQIYAYLSNNFDTRTFENDLSSRWNLTMPNDAQYVTHTVPPVMEVGQWQPVSVTMRNTGVSAWTRSGSYRLGSQNPQDSALWGLSRVEVPTDVLPGATVTFEFGITAPGRPGTYKFQWKMVQDFMGWFGHFTPDVEIRVEGQTTVPRVVEMRSGDAAEVLLAAGLEPSFTGDTGPDAWVWSQSPRGGTVVDRGSVVTLRLRTGPIP